MTYRKKLIEAALPLDSINAESAREKSIRHGHPSTLHLWWARRPLAACRAVLFSSLVDDPAEPNAPAPYLDALDDLPRPDSLTVEWDRMDLATQRRERLFAFISRLVKWDNSNDEHIIGIARRLIDLACEGNPPPVLDPFCGGGSIPLEAQRLGLEAHGSDLNPVAVLITKALIEIPPKFADRAPVNGVVRVQLGGAGNGKWKGASGLAADVRYYGKWMRDEAVKRIGYLYPKVAITAEMVAERPDLKPYLGKELTVIAWLWARTVKSPNPAFATVDVPLASTFMLSTKPGKEAYVEPVVEGGDYRFAVKVGKPSDAEAAKSGTKLARANFRCVLSGVAIGGDYIKVEGKAGRMGVRLMAIVAEGERGRVYLSPTPEMEAAALTARPTWKPEGEIAKRMTGGNCTAYGLTTFGDLFTDRQLVALTTFSDLVGEARERVLRDATAANLLDDARPLAEGGSGARAYADAVATYLALAVDKAIDRNTTLCAWESAMGRMRGTFGRQALPMVWDFVETQPFAGAGGDLTGTIGSLCEALDKLDPGLNAFAKQLDAIQSVNGVQEPIVSTDPPYYDNIGYADLSDFFYVWLRRSLRDIYPSLFTTLLTPKDQELVATPYRFDGDKHKAERFFREGLATTFAHMRKTHNADFPLTVYYAFKQTEQSEMPLPLFGDPPQAVGTPAATSTGWETMLEGLVGAGFAITGTWPVRSELANRNIASGTNALASSIVLVCRPRPSNAPSTGRSEFLQELSAAMREALPVMTHGQIAPVDLAQASIGPGMGVYSKFAQVLRQDGKPVTVREALQDINNVISAYRTERTGSFDEKTRFCIDFYQQYGFTDAPFGEAQNLARAKNVGVNVLEADQLLVADSGRAWLVPMKAYPIGVPGLERSFAGSAWEACLRLAATLQEEGESATAALARELGEGVCARARELAVWLYTIADSRKRSQDALAFNALDASWPEIQRLMAAMDRGGQQGRFA